MFSSSVQEVDALARRELESHSTFAARGRRFRRRRGGGLRIASHLLPATGQHDQPGIEVGDVDRKDMHWLAFHTELGHDRRDLVRRQLEIHLQFRRAVDGQAELDNLLEQPDAVEHVVAAIFQHREDDIKPVGDRSHLVTDDLAVAELRHVAVGQRDRGCRVELERERRHELVAEIGRHDARDEIREEVDNTGVAHLLDDLVRFFATGLVAIHEQIQVRRTLLDREDAQQLAPLLEDETVTHAQGAKKGTLVTGKELHDWYLPIYELALTSDDVPLSALHIEKVYKGG